MDKDKNTQDYIRLISEMEERKKKKEKKTWKKLLVILAVISGLIAIGHIYRFVRSFEKSAVNEFPGGIEVEVFEKYMESKKNVDSDIKGLSQYDKYKMGLDYKDGSDTDHDGLTDKEEIEKYKTDPLKESTAEDLYTDGYKVKHHLPLFSNCEYKKEINFSGNKCKEVELEADEPSDLKAVVEDCTKRYSLECYGIEKIYKGFWIYNYSGKVKIGASTLLKKNKISEKDISVWIIKGAFVVNGLSEPEECDYVMEQKKIIIDYDFKKNEEYFIYITEKKKWSIGKMFTPSITTAETDGISFIHGFPIVEQLFGIGMNIDYSEMETEKESKSLAKHSVSFCNSHMGSKIKYTDASKVKKKSKTSISMKEKVISFLFPFFEYNPRKGASIFNYFYAYVSFSDSGYDIGLSASNTNEYREDRGTDVTGEFNPYIDELPFQNFASEIGERGNCVGIAHLTSYLYNRRKNVSSGSYKCKINGKDKVVNWNLDKDEENKTLLDAGLYDFKDKSFVDAHSGDGVNFLNKDLSKGEKEFKKMVGCYWAEGNTRFDLNDYTNTNGKHDDWSMIESMLRYLDKGKIVDVYMLLKAGYGHAVNVYGYHYLADDEIAFYVYDSNLPQDRRAGFKLNFEMCVLQVKKIKDVSGNDKFEYLYYPIKGNENVTYMASSNQGLMEENAIVILDEKWNVLK